MVASRGDPPGRATRHAPWRAVPRPRSASRRPPARGHGRARDPGRPPLDRDTSPDLRRPGDGARAQPPPLCRGTRAPARGRPVAERRRALRRLRDPRLLRTAPVRPAQPGVRADRLLAPPGADRGRRFPARRGLLSRGRQHHPPRLPVPRRRLLGALRADLVPRHRDSPLDPGARVRGPAGAGGDRVRDLRPGAPDAAPPARNPGAGGRDDRLLRREPGHAHRRLLQERRAHHQHHAAAPVLLAGGLAGPRGALRGPGGAGDGGGGNGARVRLDALSAARCAAGREGAAPQRAAAAARGST